EVEDGDDVVGSGRDELHGHAHGAVHEHAHPALPGGEPHPRAPRVGRNGERLPSPRAHLGPLPLGHVYLRPDRVLRRSGGPGSASVIPRLAPRLPHGGGVPSPTRMVTTGKGGAAAGQGVRQSLTITSRSIGSFFLSANARIPTPTSVPPPPYSSTCAAENTF